MIGGNVPKHLVVGARTGFLTALKEGTYDWRRVAMEVPIGAKNVDLVDLGAAPMPKNSKSGITIQDMIEKTKQVSPEDWDITVWISENAINDDQTGGLLRRVRQAGRNYNRHINKRVFQVLNAGDGTTYGSCYDSQDFFDSDHVDKGADYQTAQDNENVLALSLDNFETVWVAGQSIVNDQGEYTEYMYDLLVCNPSLARTAYQIAGNPEDYATSNRAQNPWSGKVSYITNANLDTSAWHLIASSEEIKPLLLVMREEPHLQHAWFDPTSPEGGRHYFKFIARYEVHYGDWRLAIQGQT